ncbi:MAG: 4-hydroxy-tetrahydrodipicolinate synthase [Candidatus Bathyarchaeota archaeon]|jgi:4-hydroxy-tetrahydrodipicolinate synthase|nr:4-hydroxy-tetrahydrodipicolinate synthase [Candidatus Bathyarchaeota archaeon A05DMB-5]MDH7558040.1 4-hydroxy-tetrahydrodipicolinate synthase [Candidatus Bathyarchaeota archaeon]
MYRPEGILPALVTPFTDDGTVVDEERLRVLVNHCIELGVHGVVPCGTTGEFVNMTTEEKKQVIKTVVDEVNGRVKVVAGTGASGTDQALEMTKYAKDVGADAVLIVTPFYLKPADRGIYEHYDTIASKADMPIILYNIPQCTGLPLPWQMVEDLAQIPNIVGVKDSSGQLNFILAVLEKVRDKINVLCGHDEVVVAALAAGCTGAILASANVIPDIWVQVYNHIKNGELQKARELQYKVQKIARIIAGSGAVGTKEALNMMKIKVGPVRKPLSVGGELTYEAREELRLDLEKIGKIKPKAVTFEIAEKTIEQRFMAVNITPDIIKDFKLRVGEALAGGGAEVAHIDLIIGKSDGPVGEAFAKAKAAPTPGHEPLLAILEPNLSVKPVTLIVPTVTITSMRQASMVYGPAQTAVAKAVVDSVADGTIPKEAVEDLIIIANVFVHPTAVDRQRVYINNYKAMRHAIRKAIEGRPNIDELIENKDRSKHPFKYTP